MLCCISNFLSSLSSFNGIVGLGVILGIFYFTFIWDSECDRKLKKFPGPHPYPIVGNALSLKNPETVVPIVMKWHEEYGCRFRILLGTKIKNLILTAPEDIEKILTSNVLIDKSNAYDVLQPWLGLGLLLSSGQKWHTRRKMLTPAFHFKILDNFLPIINEQSKVFVDVLKDASRNGNVIGIQAFITRCALDIICETAMGNKLNCQSDFQKSNENVFAAATLKESAYVWERWTSPWLQWDFTFAFSKLGRDEKANRQILHDFTDQVIKERKEELSREPTISSNSDQTTNDENVYFSNKKRFAFLDLLIKVQAEAGLTDQDLREETDTFMFEGHDTTAAGICWAVFLIGLSEEAQSKVHDELDSIFGDDKERSITTTDLSKMKYLECCIKESLRLYPSVPFFSRLLKRDFQLGKCPIALPYLVIKYLVILRKLDQNSLLPKGASVVIAPFLTHRNPTIFPEPERFDPTRFFLENASGRHPYSYIPFSAGPRGCIGQRFAVMEEKTVLATLFRHFKVECLDKREDVKPLTELIMRPKDEIRVKLTVR